MLPRPLGRMETALTYTDEFSPLNLVGVARVAGGPSPADLRRALDSVQARHPILRVCLAAAGRRRFFQPAGGRSIPLRVLPRQSDRDWQAVTEAELNERLPVATGPLLRAAYLYDSSGAAELILTAQHSILDAASALTLWDEVLTLCSGGPAAPTAPHPSDNLSVPIEARYPAGQRGLRGGARLLAFMARQLADEIMYRRQARSTPPPAIHLNTRCRILPLQLAAAPTAAILERCRRERVTVNSALSAALLLAVHQHRYGAAATALRGITFGNLRPYLKPPPAPADLGCYITLMRYTVALAGDSAFWAVARAINHRIYQAARRGEKFAAAWLSPVLVSAVQRLRSMRLGVVALSYSGVTPLPEHYGALRLLGLHGFVSNHGLGPEYTAAVRLFRDELWWDVLYLDTDLEAGAAQAIGADILARLAAAAARASSPVEPLDR
jgi:hypothetical protein